MTKYFQKHNFADIFVERVASGIPRMQEAIGKAILPEPEFKTERLCDILKLYKIKT